jgi:hypothetical protein
MLRSGQRVVYWPELRTGQLQDSLNKNRFVVTKKGNRLVFTNQFGMESTLPKSADGNYHVFSPDEIFFANHGGMAFDSSRKNIVPGMGDKDTVPAVLTPGEFVINKDSAKQNLDLLHAINSGKMSNMGKGGGVATRGREFYGEIDQDIKRMMKAFAIQGHRINSAEAALFIKEGVSVGDVRRGLISRPADPGPKGGMQGMRGFGLSMGIGAAGGALMMGAGSVSNQAIGGAMNVGGTALSMLSILPFLGKAAGPVTAIVAAGAAIVSVVAGMKALSNSVKDLNNAMLGSTDRVNAMAQAFGRTTNVQQVALQKAQAAGGPIGEQALQTGGQFLQTAAGSRLIKDLQLVRTAGKDQVEALTKQLQRGILAGAITTEEARGIAIQVGQALGSQKLGVQASVAITSIFGPNGEKLENNRLQIASQIVPEISGEELDKLAPELAKEMGKIDFSKGFNVSAFGTSLLTLGGQLSLPFLEQEAKFKAIGNAAIEAAQIEKEQIASVILARQQGTISIEQYRRELEKILELDISGQGFEQAAKAFADVSNIPLESLTTTKLSARDELFADSATFAHSVGKEQKDVMAFYKEIENQFKNIAAQQGKTRFEIQATIDLAQKLGETKFEQGKILSSLSGGEFDSTFINKISELADKNVIEDIFPKNLGNRAKQMKELSIQLETFSAIPGLQEKILTVAIAERHDERGANRGKSVAEIVKGYENAYAAVEKIPEEVKKVLNIDMGDTKQLLEYQNIAPEIEKQYNRVANYIKKTNDDISKEDVQMRIVSFYAGENAHIAKKMIEMAGKSFDPVKLPLLISMMADPNTVKLMQDYNKALEQRAKSPEEARFLRAPVDELINALSAASGGATPSFDPDKKDGAGGAKSALQQLIEGYQVGIKFAQIREKLLAIGTPEQLFAELEGMGAEGLKIANSLLGGKNKELLKLAKKADVLATTKLVADQINELGDSIKNIKFKKNTFNELLGIGVSREDAEVLINNSSFMLALEKAKGKERTKLINKAREQLQAEKDLTQALKTQSEIQLENIDKQIEIKNDRLSLLELEEEQFRLINIGPIEDQINAIEKINEGIARSIELEQRKIEPIQKAIEGLEEQKNKVDERYDSEIDAVNEAYDLRIQSLERAEQINQRIVQQQQAQVGLASALSRGDIAAAVQAMLQMQKEDAAARSEDARQALQDQRDAQVKELELAREREIDAIQAQINVKKAEQEAIEAVIESLQFQQLQNSDAIYNLGLQIEAVERTRINNLNTIKDLEAEILRLRIEQSRVVISQFSDGGDGGQLANPSSTSSLTPNQSKHFIPGYSAANIPSGEGRIAAEVAAHNKKVETRGITLRQFGGMINYKGSREPAPGMALGGMMKKYARGSFVSGMGNTDNVPALLTPGEYIINKASTKAFLPLLEMINGSKFPSMLGNSILPAQNIRFNMPNNTDIKFNMPQEYDNDFEVNTKSQSYINAPQKYNNYIVNVDVGGTNASPDLIASAVIGKIRTMEDRSLRSVRY